MLSEVKVVLNEVKVLRVITFMKSIINKFCMGEKFYLSVWFI